MKDKGKYAKRRLWLPDLKAGESILDPQSAHYLKTVLRLRTGENVELFDGKGNYALSELTQVDKKQVYIQAGSIEKKEPPTHELVVALAIPKRDRADWAIEKLCELGVTRIVWLQCDRSVAQPQKDTQKYARWERLSQSAASQSGRYFLPEIEGPLASESFFQRSYSQKILAHFTSASLFDHLPKLEISEDIALAVGPEGGFSQREMRIAMESNYLPLRLGPHTLRTETAAIAGASMLSGVYL